jgi:hypothetical protein
MAGFNQCVDDIIKAAGGILSKREAAELLRKFNNTAKRMSAEDRFASLDAMLTEARENMIQRNVVASMVAKRSEVMYQIKLDNLTQRTRNLAATDKRKKPELFMAQDTKGSIKSALDALLFGRPDSREGLAQTVMGARTRFHVALVASLQDAGVIEHFKDPDIFSDALEVAFNPSAKVQTPESQTIGNILRTIQKLSVRRLNEVGSYVLDTPRVLFNAKVADPAKVVLMGEDGFVDFVHSLDLDRRYFDGMDDSEIDDHFRKLYRELATGNQFRGPAGTFDGIGGLTKERYRNLAANFSIDYDIPFATADAFKKYAAAVSDEPLQVMLHRRVDQIGRAVGVMDALGPAPERMLDELYKKLWPDMTDADRLFLTRKDMSVDQAPTAKGVLQGTISLPFKVINSLWHDAHPDHVLSALLGETHSPVNKTAARISSGMRAWASMAALPSGVFIQVTDLALKAAQLTKYGRQPFENIVEPLAAFGRLLPSEEQARFYTRMGVGAEMMAEEIMHSLGSTGYQPGLTHKMMNGYFKLNGMYFFDAAQKRHNMDYLAYLIGDSLNAGKMDDPILRDLRSYGFTDGDFAELATHVTNIGDRWILDPEILAKSNDKLYEKFLGVADDFNRSWTLTPGVREEAVLTKGTRPGTLGGEFMRGVMMFKSYPVKLWTTVFPRIHYEYGIGGTLATMISLMAMWYVGDSMRAMAQGKTPRDLSKPDNWTVMLARSGFGGLYADLMTNNYNQYGMDFWSSVGGPLAGQIQSGAAFGSAVTHGEATPKMAINKLNRALPNLFYTKTILDKTLIHGMMESVDPGYSERAKERLRERTGQSPLF